MPTTDHQRPGARFSCRNPYTRQWEKGTGLGLDRDDPSWVWVSWDVHDNRLPFRYSLDYAAAAFVPVPFERIA